MLTQGGPARATRVRAAEHARNRRDNRRMPSHASPPDLPRLIGVDFTSTPTAGKPITVARGACTARA